MAPLPDPPPQRGLCSRRTCVPCPPSVERRHLSASGEPEDKPVVGGSECVVRLAPPPLVALQVLHDHRNCRVDVGVLLRLAAAHDPNNRTNRMHDPKRSLRPWACVAKASRGRDPHDRGPGEAESRLQSLFLDQQHYDRESPRQVQSGRRRARGVLTRIPVPSLQRLPRTPKRVVPRARRPAAPLDPAPLRANGEPSSDRSRFPVRHRIAGVAPWGAALLLTGPTGGHLVAHRAERCERVRRVSTIGQGPPAVVDRRFQLFDAAEEDVVTAAMSTDRGADGMRTIRPVARAKRLGPADHASPSAGRAAPLRSIVLYHVSRGQPESQGARGQPGSDLPGCRPGSV